MKKYKWVIILVNLLIVLLVVNNSVVQKEAILSDGKLVLLELAPVDPRSLIQGDYMRLRYTISEGVSSDSIPKRGFCVVNVLPDGTSERLRFQPEKTPLQKNEVLIEYSAVNRWNVNIGAESFFFQEGEAEKYEAAKYGGIKIDSEGNSVLVGLYNDKLQRIE